MGIHENGTEIVCSGAYGIYGMGCFEFYSQTVFIRNAWPVVVLWYGALFVFLWATSNGKLAREYARLRMCPAGGRAANDRRVDRIVEGEDEMRVRLARAASARAMMGASAELVRRHAQGVVRIPTPFEGGAWRGGLRPGSGAEEERTAATRWWIEQAEHLGILSAGRQSQQMEYVLRTRSFNAGKERERRERIRRMNSREKAIKAGATATNFDAVDDDIAPDDGIEAEDGQLPAALGHEEECLSGVSSGGDRESEAGEGGWGLGVRRRWCRR